jgi:maltokinase
MTVFTHPAALTRSLRRWLPEQRWFAGRDSVLMSLEVAAMTTLLPGDPALVHTVVEVHHPDRTDHYQLLLGTRAALPDRLSSAWICDVGDVSVYAATQDEELMVRLLPLFGRRAVDDGIRFEAPSTVTTAEPQSVRPITAEQSNTSLVFGDRHILKLFRRVLAGPHPDIDLHEALRTAGSRDVAATLGSIWGDVAGEPAALGILQEFLPHARDGWALATEDAAHPDHAGTFPARVRELGGAVARVHATLARALGTRAAGAEDAHAEVRRMHDRLSSALTATPELLDLELPARAVFERARPAIRRARLQRVHGDLHLGQVLHTGGRWVLIDFEGEPGRPLAERNAHRHPWQDVAGMLRSFDYAAHVALRGTGATPSPVAALAWADRARAAFCDGYSDVLPDPRLDPTLLRALELDKAVYEVAYERAHRPEWVSIPLGAVVRIIEGTDRP